MLYVILRGDNNLEVDWKDSIKIFRVHTLGNSKWSTRLYGVSDGGTRPALGDKSYNAIQSLRVTQKPHQALH